MIRSALAGLAGLVVSFVTVAAVEAIGGRLYPVPAGIDPADPEALARAIASLPAGAFASVLVGWTLGALLSTFTAARLAGPGRRGPAWAVAGLFAAACAFNLYALPHPPWFVLAAAALVPAALLGGVRLGLRPA